MSWKNSIHSEVNRQFVSNPYPLLGDEIEISLRIIKDNPARRIFLRAIINGADTTLNMKKSRETVNFIYYSLKIKINQPRINYHFIIETAEEYFYYTRKEVTTFPPVEDNDFVIIADFENPAWVPSSVFYQIFPDRFCAANGDNVVKDDEYIFDGHSTKKMNWNDKPLEYKEGHCLDFFGGDLEGIKEKIPYLKELGISALYLTPIFEAKTTHRYDCTDYFKVDQHLGGDEALVSLIEELHNNDMKIILDVSINHTGMEHHWYKKALKDEKSVEREFYNFDQNGNAHCWFGFHTLPQLNYKSEKLRNIIYRDESSVVKRYLKPPFNIDGWRFDVGNHTARLNEDQLGHEVFSEVRESIKSIKKDAYIVGEQWIDSKNYLMGDQWDAVMNYFSSSRPLRRFMGSLDRYAEFLNSKNRVVKPCSGIELEKMIMQQFSRLPNQLSFLQFNLLDSHDYYRLHNFKEVFNMEIYEGILKILFLLPGTVSVYYGDEIGLEGHTLTDEGLRYPMKWDSNNWDKEFYNLYKYLCNLKVKEEVLHYGSYKSLYSDDDTFVFSRFDDKKAFIAIASHNDEPKVVKIPVYLLGENKDSFALDYFTGDKFKIKEGFLEVQLSKNGSNLLEIDLLV